MPTNVGDQEVTILYHTQALSKIVNRRHLVTRQLGIYSGGYLKIVTAASASISALVCEISDGTYQVKIRTQELVTLAVVEATPYIVLRWIYTGSETADYMALIIVATPATNDLIIGKCTFSGGGNLQGFDYSERTTPDIHNLFLKVESTEDTELRVRIRAGRVQNGKETIQISDQKSDLFVPPSITSRIDLVYVNRATGAIAIDSSGTVAASPVAPNYAGKLVLAEVTLTAGDTNILATAIEDVRDFTNMSYQVDDATLEVNSSGKLQIKSVASLFTPAAYVGQESVTLPNGKIIKMGVAPFASGWGNHTITFATPFPSDCLMAMCNGGANSAVDRNSHSDTHTLSKSSFQTYGSGGSVKWIAIGW